MYRYEECGLSNVVLKNGFRLEEIDGEEILFIENVRQLHNIIGTIITQTADLLEKEEVRFLRKELDMSQKDMGNLFGVSDQAVALWENPKRSTTISKTNSALLKIIYLQHLEENPVAIELLENSKKLTDLKLAVLNFELRGSDWKPAKMAPKKKSHPTGKRAIKT